MLFKRLLSHVPEYLPVGLPQMEAWMDAICELAGPYADRDSMHYAIASNLIHLPHTKAKVSKAYFVSTLRKAAANQVASQIFQDVKYRQAQKAEETAKLEQVEDAAKKAAECQQNTTS